MSRAYPFFSGMAVMAAIVSIACGGGGGEPTTIEEAQEPTYVPAMDYLLPVPAEWGPTDAGFEVWIRGNFVEVAS